MQFTDVQRRLLKQAHQNYIWDHRTTDKFGDFLASTPVSTGYFIPEDCIHITQRNILVLLHKLGLKLHED